MRKHRFIFTLASALCVICIVTLCACGSSEITMPYSEDHFLNMPLDTAESELKELGFENIETKEVSNHIRQDFENLISTISIDGKSFSDGSKFKPEDQVTIVYYGPYEEGSDSESTYVDESYKGTDATEHAVDWKLVTIPSENSDGYTFNNEYKVSPWMLYSEEESKLKAAWREISNGQELPSFEDYASELNGAEDAYYCIGTIGATNTTSGWDIGDGDNIKDQITLNWYEGDYYDDNIPKITFLMYTGDPETGENGVQANALFNANYWGPVPFVFIFAEDVTPNYPDGRYYERIVNGQFTAWGTKSESFSVEVLGKPSGSE